MSGLFRSGAESQRVTSATATTGEPGVISTGTVAINTTTPRSGVACYSCGPSAANYVQAAISSVLGRRYFVRAAVRFSSVAPSEALTVLRFNDATGTIFEVTLEKSGKVWSWAPVAAAHVGTEGPVVEANKWYLIEMMGLVPAEGKGKLAWKLRGNDGTVLYESGESEVSVRNTGITLTRAGHQSTTESAVTVLVDDWGGNDDQGEKQNSWLGNGKIVMQKPVADVARVGWTGGAGGTTELFKGSNTPPVGVKLASATNTSQIKDANANNTDSYEAKLAAYSTPVENGGGGIGGADEITLACLVVRAGQSSATGRQVAISLVSNPVVGESLININGATAETDPTGWTSGIGAFVYAPTVEREVQPVIKIRKSASTTDSVMADLLGLLVEYVPAPTITLAPSSGAASGSLGLAAKTTIALEASSGVASATAAVAAKQTITLGASSGVASTGAITPTVRVNLQLSPAPGIYWGADMDGDVYSIGQGDAPYLAATWNQFEVNAGRKVDIVHYSDPWLTWEGFGSGTRAAVDARGAISMITIGSTLAQLNEVAEGKLDAAIEAWATKAKEFGKPIFLRLWWEMNGTWWAWGRAANYVTAWRRFYEKVNAIASNVSFVWCVNVIYEKAAEEAMVSMYPGDAYVDWTSMDGYSGENPLKKYGWKTAKTLFEPTYTKLLEIAPSKPIIIGETAASEFGGEKSAWIKELLMETLPSMPRIKAVVWFNDNIEAGGGRLDWPIESSRAAEIAFGQGIGTSYFLDPPAAGFTSGTKVPEPPARTASAAGSSSAQLFLTTGPKTIPLAPSSGAASASVALTAKTTIPLGASSGSSSTSAALTAKTTVPLAPSSGIASTSLNLRAPTTVVLGASSGIASASLSLRATALLTLAPAAGVASGSLALRAPTTIPLSPSFGVGSGTAKIRILYAKGLYIRGPSSWVKL